MPCILCAMSVAHDAYFAEVEDRFDAAVDFTIGLEEEFQLLDPTSLALVDRFEELRDAAQGELAEHVAGELISSEIEVITGRCDGFAGAADKLLLRRVALSDLADSHGVALGATGTHPFSSWKDQRIIDTPHYRLVEDRLKYVAWRNNTWSAHVHVGVHGKDRAIALCDAVRGYLPHFLALSANSPFIEGVWTQLHSARTQTFVRMFPRCGIPDIFGTWDEHRRYYELMLDTHCVQDFTQIWWSVRPHHRFGTVELRICDVQTEAWQALAINALAFGLVVALAHRYDEGRPLLVLPGRYIEENLWRAIRYGLDGKLVDFERRREVDATDAVRELLELVLPEADRLGLHPFIDDVERILSEGNGAQRQVKAHLEGETLEEVFAGTVARVRPTAVQNAATGEEAKR
jgi:glutamate---cysteine ligase / carboxylate-amine ligase